MAWIKSDQSLANHPKLILLAKELGVSKVKALGHLHLLWYWTLEYAEDGEIKYLDLIPDACEWEEDPKSFINALVKFEFNWKGDLVKQEDKIVIPISLE